MDAARVGSVAAERKTDRRSKGTGHEGSHIGRNDRGDHRVAPGRRVVGPQYDRLAGRGDLNRPANHRRGNGGIVADSRQDGASKAHPDAIALRGDLEGRRKQKRERIGGESFRIRPRKDSDRSSRVERRGGGLTSGCSPSHGQQVPPA
jgi:hypothetical protein